MSRLILTDRDREALHRLAAEWRSEPASEDRGARTRETLIGLIGGGEHLDRHAAYLLALSLVELLSPAHLPPWAGPVVLRALESLADGEGGGEYMKIMNDLHGLPGAPTPPDSPFLSLLPGMGGAGVGGAQAEPRSEDTGETGVHGLALRTEDVGESGSHGPAPGSGSAGDGEGRDPSPETLDPEAAEHAIPNFPGVDIEALARRAIQFAGNSGRDGARSRAPNGQGALTAESTSGSGIVPDGAPPVGHGFADGARSRAPNGQGALTAESTSGSGIVPDGAPPVGHGFADGVRSRAPNGQGALTAESASGSGIVPDGAPPVGHGFADGARSRAPNGQGALTAESTSGSGIVPDGAPPVGHGFADGAQSRTPDAERTPGGDVLPDRAPAAPSLESVLFFEVAGERFALRAGDVTAILGAGAHDAARIDGRPPVFVHHGVSYRFVDPARALALGDIRNAGESGPARTIVLLCGGGRRIALLCGGIDEREELPVHALPPMVPREALATAAVIAGDGRPVLLLDTAALAGHASG